MKENNKENSIEEDIKILDEMILNCRYKHNYYDEYAEESDENECDYKRVLKENEELKKSKITYEKVRDIQEKNKNIVDKNYIPVQKVKDKIEEILNNGEYRIIFEGDTEIPDEATIINAQKYIKLEKLQELLEGRK